MKLLVTNNTAVDIVFNHLGGYTLPGLASNIDFFLFFSILKTVQSNFSFRKRLIS